MSCVGDYYNYPLNTIFDFISNSNVPEKLSNHLFIRSKQFLKKLLISVLLNIK